MPVQRADARRNYELLLAVAEKEVAEHGADASMEQIARKAGVGSGTVRRHFPHRQALLTAVFRNPVERLCAQAAELGEAADERQALLDWLEAVTTYAVNLRGLATALAREQGLFDELAQANCATSRLTEAGDPLVRRAVAEGVLAQDVTVSDLLGLITGAVLATEHHPEPRTAAGRLLDLAIRGVSA